MIPEATATGDPDIEVKAPLEPTVYSDKEPPPLFATKTNFETAPEGFVGVDVLQKSRPQEVKTKADRNKTAGETTFHSFFIAHHKGNTIVTS